ncbi:J domain-containing protein [Agrobacterium vitis]|uniref:J domain-containing protein n=1 Tax=Agrobacterium vitis TaxID=373 RepID=UPI000893207F|nr:J domain-containing protein [Agrobacterium vitis]MCE6074811.1 hypothetical protein [Agrobacterium vitis]MCM2467784.1 J domain-containing protein [Agrobacterium vitis]MUO68311.1 hypothetical protein [Agrobacterium vitis]MUO83471.1 hypothetical protein [Agrobacterium vitis]MVA34853.1 hypothetical protein [Agrobacterium vitis]
MRDAWRELGLEPGADERAIKRAYALKLKLIRPDEDPSGFQRLNENYKVALKLAKQRNSSYQAQEDVPSQVNSVDVSTDLDVKDEPVITIVRHEPIVSQRQEFTRAPEQHSEVFHFDFDRFLAALFAHTASDTPEEFRHWLEQQTLAWPLSLKSKVANDVLTALIERGSLIDLVKFNHVVEVFGLDDVMVVHDPLRFALFRSHLENEDEQATRERREIAWREKRRRDAKWEYVIGAMAVLALVVIFKFFAPSSYNPPNVEAVNAQSLDNPTFYLGNVTAVDQSVIDDLNSAGDLANQGKINEASSLYTKATSAYSKAGMQINHRVLAVSLYQMAVFLKEHGKETNAEATYIKLYNDNVDSDDATIGHVVAAGTVNLANMQFDAGNLDKSLESYTKIVSRYGFDGPPPLVVQVTKAVNGQAEIMLKQGRLGMAAGVLDRLIERYASSTDPLIQAAIARVSAFRSTMIGA